MLDTLVIIWMPHSFIIVLIIVVIKSQNHVYWNHLQDNHPGEGSKEDQMKSKYKEENRLHWSKIVFFLRNSLLEEDVKL